MSKLLKQFKAARRAGTPIVSITTADPGNLIKQITENMNGKLESIPVMQWDSSRAMLPITEPGREWISATCGQRGAAQVFARSTDVLTALYQTDELQDAIVFMFQSHELFKNPIFEQGVWNLRDQFKPKGNMLVLMAPHGWKLPSSIQNDITPLDDPLPDKTTLKTIVNDLCEAAKNANAEFPIPETEMLDMITDSVCGISAYAAEQAVSMSITKKGVDMDEVWDRKRMTIEQTRGLSVWKQVQSFDDIGGYRTIKDYIAAIASGMDAPRVVLFIDEIEKGMAGAQGDMSGISQDFHGTFLSWTQDVEAAGMIFLGPPGSGKSVMAKSIGNIAQCPTISFDINSMKQGIVGTSGENIRRALDVVQSVGQSKVLMVATCNGMDALSTELRRRFTLGTFFFDLPTQEEQKAIWNIWMDKYKLLEQKLPPHKGWTGAEIKQCCNIAYRLRCTLVKAAKYIIPIAKSSAERIQNLQREASGTFLSASYDGEYQMNKQALQGSTKGRKLELE